MTQSAQQSPFQLPAQAPRRRGAPRTIAALMLREMSTTYGRSAFGYFWAIFDSVASVMLMSFLFSLAFRTPSIGTSFPLFYASGMLPFSAYQDVSQKISVALRFSKSLLFYPGVTFIDALIARFLVNALTQVMIFTIVLTLIIQVFDLNVILDLPNLALAFVMAFSLAAGIGTLNCYLLSTFPLWERAWAVLTRPLFIVSCVMFVFNAIPQPFQGWLWWNPLVHVVGQARKGIYSTYDGSYVSPFYVFAVSGVTFTLGLLLLRRYHRDITNF